MIKFIHYLVPLTMFTALSCGQEQPAQAREPSAEEETSPPNSTSKTILFFGNSLTAGLGVDQEETYPAEIQEIIDSLDLNYEVINAGLSGETTAGGKSRISWVLRQPVDVFVLELGANDGLRGVPPRETRANLQAIIDSVRKKSPGAEIILAGMQIPPNMGEEYASEFRQIYPQLAEENNIHLIPFLLEGVAANPKLNQEDGIHPTAEGYDIVARNVWQVLEEVLETNSE